MGDDAAWMRASLQGKFLGLTIDGRQVVVSDGLGEPWEDWPPAWEGGLAAEDRFETPLGVRHLLYAAGGSVWAVLGITLLAASAVAGVAAAILGAAAVAAALVSFHLAVRAD